MQWNEKELDTQFSPNVYFWTPNSKILAKALDIDTYYRLFQLTKLLFINTLYNILTHVLCL